DNVAGRVAKFGLLEKGKWWWRLRPAEHLAKHGHQRRLDGAVLTVLDPDGHAQALLAQRHAAEAFGAALGDGSGEGGRQLGIEVTGTGDHLRVAAHNGALAWQQLR